MNRKAFSKRKYNILDRLNQLPHEEYRIAKNKLPLALKISKRTFERWIYLSELDRLEIPADKLAIIAKYLCCTIEELFNYKIPQFNTSKLKMLEDDSLALELNLIQ